MVEADSLEAIAAFTANAINAFALYISFTFAFLLVCHFVGKTLKKNQVILLSFLYIFATGSTGAASISNMLVVEHLSRTNAPALNEVPLWDFSIWVPVIAVLCLMGIVACLYYLWDLRRADT